MTRYHPLMLSLLAVLVVAVGFAPFAVARREFQFRYRPKPSDYATPSQPSSQFLRAYQPSRRVRGKPEAPLQTGPYGVYKIFLRRAKEDPESGTAMKELMHQVSDKVKENCRKWYEDVLVDLTGPLHAHLTSEEGQQLNELKQNVSNAVPESSRCETWARLMPQLKIPTTTVLRGLAYLKELRVAVTTYKTHDITEGIVDAMYAHPPANIWSVKELYIECYVEGPTGCRVKSYEAYVGASHKSLFVDYLRRRERNEPQPPSFSGEDAFYKSVVLVDRRRPQDSYAQFIDHVSKNHNVNPQDLAGLKQSIGDAVGDFCSDWYNDVLKDLNGPLKEHLSSGEREQVNQLKGGSVSGESKEFLCSTWKKHVERLKVPTTAALRGLAEFTRSRIVITSYDNDNTFAGGEVLKESPTTVQWKIEDYAIYHFTDEDRYQPIDKFRSV